MARDGAALDWDGQAAFQEQAGHNTCGQPAPCLTARVGHAHLLGRAGHGGARLVARGYAAGHQAKGACRVAPVLLLHARLAAKAVHHDGGHRRAIRACSCACQQGLGWMAQVRQANETWR